MFQQHKSGGSPKWIGPDYTTQDGANVLAQRIEDYWARRGVDVCCIIEPINHGTNYWHAGYQVRSNIDLGKTVSVNLLRESIPQ